GGSRRPSIEFRAQGLLLRREHLPQRGQNGCHRLRLDLAEFPHKPVNVDRTDLGEDDKALSIVEGAADSSWVEPALARQRRDDDRMKMPVHLVRRDHDAGPLLLNFAANRWVQSNEIDLRPGYCHSHSSSSQRVGTNSLLSRRASSP